MWGRLERAQFAAIVVATAVTVGGVGGLGGTTSAQSAGFDVTVVETNSPVTAGDAVRVTATVENTGDSTTTRDVTLTVADGLRDAKTVVLDPGETTTIELSWVTDSGDAGGYTATVATDGGSDSAAVNVLEPASFDVSIASTTSPVTDGDPLEVDAQVTNTGSETGTQTGSLSAGSTQLDTTEVALAPGESRTVTLVGHPDALASGEYTATVASDDDAATAAVTVLAAPDFAVSIASTTSPVADGEDVRVSALVRNTGDVRETREVVLTAGATERDTTTVTLDGGASKRIDLVWTPASGTSGDFTVSVAVGDSSDTAAVTVEREPARVNFSSQAVADTSQQAVTVDAAALPDGGFLVVYRSYAEFNADPTDAIGASQKIAAGQTSNLPIFLDERLENPQNVTVVSYEDTDGNNVLDLTDSADTGDEPYLRAGEPVRDSALVRVDTPTSTPTTQTTSANSTTDSSTGSSTDASADSTTDSSADSGTDSVADITDTRVPGFGPVVALLALAIVTGLVGRRN